METSTLEVVTVPLSASELVTPSAPTATFSTRTPVWIATPCFLSSAASSAATSSSSVGRMRGIISTTVTFVPSVLKREANSHPSTPPPTINRLSGIVVRSNASRLVMT